MFSSTSYAPNPSFLPEVLNNLGHFLPNLLSSLVISILGSIVLTGLVYWLNAALGIPVIPFLFVMF